MKQIRYILIVSVMLTIQGFSQNPNSDLKILDSNKDGIINPYEALDVLLSMQKENGNEISLKDMNELISNYEKESQEEIEDILKEYDTNHNGQVELSEVQDEEFLYFMELMDTDKNKSVNKEEMTNFRYEDAMFLSDKDLKKEVKYIFKEYSSTDEIIIANSRDSLRSEMLEWDIDRDGRITKEEALRYLKYDNTEALFEVKGTTAYMYGVICASTPGRVLELLITHPEVKTIEMINVPGSIDDVANLRASLYVYRYGINTKLNKTSVVASGGTDFFLAGRERTVVNGAMIGVHSWGGGPKAATELPKKHRAHKKYLEYYRAIDIPEDFYWYTLDAAPASDIHFMTEEEIIKYKIRTKK